MTKVVMDRSVLSPYVGDDLMDVGCETGMPIVGAVGYFFLQMVNLARQVLFQVIHSRDLLGDFSQVVAFRSQTERFPEHGGMTRDDAAEELQVGGALWGDEFVQTLHCQTQRLRKWQR